MVTEFNRVLAEAKAAYEAGCISLAAKYVPQLYAAYRKETSCTPGVIAYEIYRATACMWRKDTVRRYLPAESKNQMMVAMRAARDAKAKAVGKIPTDNCRRLATVTDSASGEKLTVPVDPDPDNSETYRDMRDGENLDLIAKLKEDHEHIKEEFAILRERFDKARKKCTCGGFKTEFCGGYKAE